jgi:UDP-glucose 4-epimerase
MPNHSRDEKGMKVVVTGGAGFVGANLCRIMAEEPEIGQVVAVDDLSTGFKSNLVGIDARLVEGTILDSDLLDSVLEGAAAVVHLAARPSVSRSLADPVASHTVNATGTVQVLEAARRAGDPLVVLASSSSVYGANPVLPKHEGLAPMPMSPYAASKLAMEAYGLAYGHSFGLPVLTFRFFNIFGPLQQAGHAYAAVIPAFISAALSGEPLTIFGDGRQSRDFTNVDTVASVITQAVLKRISSNAPINLAYGTRTDLLTLVALLEEIIGQTLSVQLSPSRRGDVQHSQADSSRLLTLLPHVTPISLKAGLEATVEWFRSVDSTPTPATPTQASRGCVLNRSTPSCP